MDQTWLAGALVLVTILHVLVLVAALRVRRGGSHSERSSADVADAGVACPDCGARNEPAFRFCRGCATELPGRGVAGAGGESATGRRTH